MTWRTYGVNWLGLDAPRHTVLFSEKAFVKAASDAGFTVERTIFDSAGLQFWGSEGYRNDIPLMKQRASRLAKRAYQRKANELNRLHEGDQACFFLRPV